MLDYNFLQLISRYSSIHTNSPFHTITSKPFLSSDLPLLIDEIWNRIIDDRFIEDLEFNAKPFLTALKNDVLISLYASLVFTNKIPIAQNEILEHLCNFDPALKENPDSLEYERQNLSHHRKSLKDFYQPGGTTVLTSGQYLSTSTLFYLKSFWEDNEIKCFDIKEFIKFIKNHSLWPFWNIYGMSFFDYFKGIREMSPDPNFYSPNISSSAFNFDNIFSFYIFEELFSPINFIQNITLHLNTFKDIFYETKRPEREKSIILMQPLFKLPLGLWSLLSNTYIASLAEYIKTPKDLYTLTDFKSNMGIVIFCNQYIFPLLKIVIGNILYGENDGNLEIITKGLKEYIVNNSAFHNYQTLLNEHMCLLANTMYPSKFNKPISLDSYGKYLLDNNLTKKAPDDSAKRNNISIKSYEINFTYNFFCPPDTYDFFSCAEHRPGLNVSSYIIDGIHYHLNNSYSVKKSLTTFNYLRTKTAELNIRPGTII